MSNVLGKTKCSSFRCLLSSFYANLATAVAHNWHNKNQQKKSQQNKFEISQQKQKLATK